MHVKLIETKKKMCSTPSLVFVVIFAALYVVIAVWLSYYLGKLLAQGEQSKEQLLKWRNMIGMLMCCIFRCIALLVWLWIAFAYDPKKRQLSAYLRFVATLFLYGELSFGTVYVISQARSIFARSAYTITNQRLRFYQTAPICLYIINSACSLCRRLQIIPSSLSTSIIVSASLIGIVIFMVLSFEIISRLIRIVAYALLHNSNTNATEYPILRAAIKLSLSTTVITLCMLLAALLTPLSTTHFSDCLILNSYLYTVLFSICAFVLLLNLQQLKDDYQRYCAKCDHCFELFAIKWVSFNVSKYQKEALKEDENEDEEENKMRKSEIKRQITRRKSAFLHVPDDEDDEPAADASVDL